MFVGRIFDEIAPFAHDLRRVLDGEELGGEIDLGSKRVQAELEARDDAEIAAAAAHRPEEVGVFAPRSRSSPRRMR